MSEFEHVTTDAAVAVYDSATGVFVALLKEVRELSKKKPDATLSANKVNLINNVLTDLIGILKAEPEGKYLAVLEDDELPQVSDALLMMVQFDTALDAFKDRYYEYIKYDTYDGEHFWITEEQLAKWDAEDEELDDEDADSSEG